MARTKARKTPGAGKKTGRRRRTTTPEPSPPVAVHIHADHHGNPITLNTDDAETHELLQKLAMRWRYVLLDRARWNGDPDSSRRLRGRALEDMQALGLTGDDLERLSHASHIEVQVEYAGAEVGWEARILPWEYLLSAATKQIRPERNVFITRHLDRGGSSRRRRSDAMLFIQCAPGRLAGHYTFESERRLIMSSLELPVGQRKTLTNPSPEELEAALDASPTLVHFTGFDGRQGRALLEPPGTKGKDGLYLRSAETDEEGFFESEAIGPLLASGTSPPDVVTLAAHHTGARIAAITVAAGARAAIGFQDTFDDALSELFFATFYRAYKPKRDVLSATRTAWFDLRAQAKDLQGTGIVVWSAESLRSESKAVREARTRIREERTTAIEITAETDVRELCQLEVVPEASLNYAALHNGQSPFKQMYLRKFAPGELRNLEIQAELFVGVQEYRYRGRLDLTLPRTELRDRVRVPLDWGIARSVVESVRTGLHLRVQVGEHVLHEHTHRVTLHPPNQWQDNQRDGPWLPSFVLPRDPAVERIVEAARPSLRALLDDPRGGFDGYQSVMHGELDPAAGVDMQVQALWSALAFEHDIEYINPPPSYEESSQRLRTPTDVLRTRSGTCIDLALMLAACLEYVDIYPVLFLMRGHATLGYWRTDEAHARYYGMADVFEGPRPSLEELSPHRLGHVIGSDGHAEVLALVESEDIVPLEATEIAHGGSFGAAVERGIQAMSGSRQFDAMIDIRRARVVSAVTPLPYRGATDMGDNGR